MKRSVRRSVKEKSGQFTLSNLSTHNRTVRQIIITDAWNRTVVKHSSQLFRSNEQTNKWEIAMRFENSEEKQIGAGVEVDYS